MNFEPIMPTGDIFSLENQSSDNIITDEDDTSDERSRSSVDVLLTGVPTTFEKDPSIARQRISQLYPMIDLDKGPKLPSVWSKYDKFDSLRVSDNGLRVTYRMDIRLKSPNNAYAASIRADAPIPVRCGLYYFEITIVRGHKGCMGLGVCEKDVQTNRLPGWDRHSYGYHGDDGNFFSASGNGTKYGPNFSTGDIVGCGVDMVNRAIFFTKNGKNLGLASRDVTCVDALYPTIGLQAPGEIVDVNFGQVPFCYDVIKDIELVRDRVSEQILQLELPIEKGDMLKEMVSSWLQTEGFSKTMTSFAKTTNQKTEESEKQTQERRAICDLIRSGRTGDAISQMEVSYPDIFVHNTRAAVLLKAQQFVEMARGVAGKTYTTRPSENRNRSEFSNGNSATEPSSTTVVARSNPNKRPHSHANDPPSARNGNSVSNGKSIGDGANTIDDCGLEQGDCSFSGVVDGERKTEESEICEEERQDVMQCIVLGREVSSMARSVNLSPEEASFVDESLATLCLTRRGFRGHSLLSGRHLRKMARIANAAILEYHGLPSLSRVDQLCRVWAEKRRELEQMDSPVVHFIDCRGILFNRDSSITSSPLQSDDDEGGSESEEGSESEQTDRDTEGDSYTSDSSSYSSSSSYEDEEGLESDDEREETAETQDGMDTSSGPADATVARDAN